MDCTRLAGEIRLVCVALNNVGSEDFRQLVKGCQTQRDATCGWVGGDGEGEEMGGPCEAGCLSVV